MMRIGIRNQLAALVVLVTLVSLAILSIATYFTNYNHFVVFRKSRLTVVASLKAAQLSSNLALMDRAARSLSSRTGLQNALQRYNDGNNTSENWTSTQQDLESAMGGQQINLLTLQSIVFPRSNSGTGDVYGLLNVTAAQIDGTIQIPYPAGPVAFGAHGLGYPPALYPNFTYDMQGGQSIASFEGKVLTFDSSLLLGPLLVNGSFVLVSFTVPIVNNTLVTDVLGYMTVVLDGNLLFDVNDSPIGLGATGMTLIVGPNTVNNLLPNDVPASGLDMRFIVPTDEFNGTRNRHLAYQYPNPLNFNGSTFPAAQSGLTQDLGAVDNAGGNLKTHNENGRTVGVGYAKAASNACDWLVMVEFDYSEVWESIIKLRNVILACVFGTAAGVILFTYPLAHFSSRPIRRLREATINAVEPTHVDFEGSNPESITSTPSKEGRTGFEKGGAVAVTNEKRSRQGSTVSPCKHTSVSRSRDVERGGFQIPGKVPDGNHFVEDELTDLTRTFNEMVDELTLQYGRLEERVKQRTAELELSKKAAESANESKTLFIANISHELKTPLNGILGMCTLAMNEEDPVKIKRSLGIIYKSGDLLHHLLTDLLTFSKHQAGKNLSLDEKQFRLGDIGIQLHAIFQKQAADGHIDFSIQYRGPRDSSGALDDRMDGLFGPENTGKVEDMVLFGDSQRVLQVLINLISNSLKFTPAGGRVSLRMTCVQRIPDASSMSREPSLALSETLRSKAGGFVQKFSGRASNRASIASSSSDDPPDPQAPAFSFEFEVTDTGPGIPGHLQTQIFEPFVQGDLRLTKKFGGTGLGLSICSQLSRLMKGNLSLKSELGMGSVFTLCIPLKLCKFRRDSMAGSIVINTSPPTPPRQLSRRSSTECRLDSPSKNFDADSNPRLVGFSQPYFSTATPPMASPGTHHSKKEAKLRILIAEDNSLNAEIVTRMLKLEDVFDVTLAKDGQEAVDKVKESMERSLPYDLILMDVQMPNLDGRQSTRLIREAGYSAPIVALTAFSDEINQRECLDSGMDYFLAKPIKRPALKHVLKTYCTTILEGEEGDQPHQEQQEHDREEQCHNDHEHMFLETDPFAQTARERLAGVRGSDDDIPASPTTVS